ncbi:putative metalloprotease CJM1_0395 family protein [Lysinibacillus sp. KU-BSD001]|uniref:putative metalloprotease CJM1_0395 family protein n=1 Tax=Lysinibacillus sp. KU-BSD001 TaxID=3141328 RepID=UPI0036ECE46D
MKIAQLMTGTSFDLEQRKRAIQRREMGDAYKKNAQYQSPKNEMLEVLENLLSGKTEKELHAADQAAREFEASASNEQKLERTETEGMAHQSMDHRVTGPITYTDGSEYKPYIDGGEVPISMQEETLTILEKVRAAALAPAEPSPQDLRVAASATAQIEQTRAAIARPFDEEETEPFADVDTSVEIPARFMHPFDERDASQGTLLTGRELDSLLYNRTFKKASMNYSNHIAMVKNGYRSLNEPTFSQTA